MTTVVMDVTGVMLLYWTGCSLVYIACFISASLNPSDQPQRQQPQGSNSGRHSLEFYEKLYPSLFGRDHRRYYTEADHRRYLCNCEINNASSVDRDNRSNNVIRVPSLPTTPTFDKFSQNETEIDVIELSVDRFEELIQQNQVKFNIRKPKHLLLALTVVAISIAILLILIITCIVVRHISRRNKTTSPRHNCDIDPMASNSNTSILPAASNVYKDNLKNRGSQTLQKIQRLSPSCHYLDKQNREPSTSSSSGGCSCNVLDEKGSKQILHDNSINSSSSYGFNQAVIKNELRVRCQVDASDLKSVLVQTKTE